MKQKCNNQIKFFSFINQLTEKKFKKKSVIKEFISEARQRELKLNQVKQSKNYDHIIDEKLIESYNKLQSKMKINATSLFISEKADRSKSRPIFNTIIFRPTLIRKYFQDMTEEISRINKIWLSTSNAEKKVCNHCFI